MQKPPSYPFGGSAVVGSFVASQVRRRGGGEDPWLCGPGFGRVCICRLGKRWRRYATGRYRSRQENRSAHAQEPGEAPRGIAFESSDLWQRDQLPEPLGGFVGRLSVAGYSIACRPTGWPTSAPVLDVPKLHRRAPSGLRARVTVAPASRIPFRSREPRRSALWPYSTTARRRVRL